ncbi:MAG: alpha/beta hydrolase [Alphaproteobacteria bacterium]|jgi:pimeloyl-ACP methyl ester carboxylesterase|nr:alpha/beta hydrolase [Alphaproteobacteria bacterium]
MLPHYDVHDGDGPYLLLVHGMLSSRAQWMCNIEALAAVARPVVVELWGHARSPAPEDPAAYHPDAYVDRFEQIRERLGAERWFVCGQSFGAGLTLRYALDHPDRVIGQIFTNSNSALADRETVATYRQNAKARADLVRRSGRAGLEEIPVHPVHGRRIPPEVKAALLSDAAQHKPDAFTRTFQHTSPHLSVRERIAENQVPTLLVHGQRESRFRPVRDFVAASMPMTEVVDAEAGHGVNIQAAETFNRVAAEFIAKHVSTADPEPA